VQNFALKSLRWVTISYFYDSINFEVEIKPEANYISLGNFKTT
jgi:hypothetical protein